MQDQIIYNKKKDNITIIGENALKFYKFHGFNAVYTFAKSQNSGIYCFDIAAILIK